jgi:predicted DNA-binding protein (UPF0251 family)
MATLDRVPATEACITNPKTIASGATPCSRSTRTFKPSVNDFIEKCLTPRQKEVVKLYYYYGKTQEDIAVILQLTQSTVSRHLFGTVRSGKKVGGAIPKLRKLMDRTDNPAIAGALATLQGKFRRRPFDADAQPFISGIPLEDLPKTPHGSCMGLVRVIE